MKAPFIRGVRVKRDEVPDFNRYPFNLPAVRNLDTLELHPGVTFFVGENGSGKSTLMEAIAIKLGFNAEGGGKNFTFSTHATHSELHEFLFVERGWARRTDGYFLRAESFYNLATNIEELGITKGYGDAPLHAQSHGESFLALITNRFQGEGVYLLDEPEAALSPIRQMSVLSYFHRMVHHHSQLIVATHSPILLAYPHAWIYQFSDSGVARVNYTETEHYQVTRDFLNRHERMTEILLTEEELDLKKTER